MIKDRGFDAIINDLLIDNVLTMGSVFVAYVTAFLAYLYLKYTNPAYNSSGGFSAPIIAFAFLIGLQMVLSLLYRTTDKDKYRGGSNQEWYGDIVRCDGGGSSSVLRKLSGSLPSHCSDIPTTYPWCAEGRCISGRIHQLVFYWNGFKYGI